MKAASVSENLKLPSVYLLDVEGTTSPVSMVYDQLFPYARKHLESFLRSQYLGEETQADLALLNQENQAESGSGAPRTTDPADIDQALSYIVWLMDQDRKSTALKSLQGRIWKAGFDTGELTGTVFPDVPEALSRWSKRSRVAIYSSGSIESQKQLFSHSSAGDLEPYLSAYFDTRVGAKIEPESYSVIAQRLNVTPSEILFLSDVTRELDSARDKGCLTRLCVREGNLPVSNRNGHLVIRSFAEVA